MLSTTLMSDTRLKCWCTIAMPWASESAGPDRLEPRAAVTHAAAVRPVDAENQIAQRGFPGAVFAENAVNFAGRMSSETSDKAVKLPNRFVIAEATEAVRRWPPPEPDAMFIAATSALQTR